MFYPGKLTHEYFTCVAIILLYLLQWILLNSCAISREFLVVYVYGIFIKLFNL